MRKAILISLLVLSLCIISGSRQAAANTFTVTGSMLTTREGHTATLLKSGKVLVVGGMHWTTGCITIRCGLQLSALASAELYDPATGKFTPTGKMRVPRVFHTATLLANGKVLIAGGDNRSSTYASAEVYDPATGIFTLLANKMTTPRSAHTATRLANGEVLIAGGYGVGGALFTAEIFDPVARTFTPTGSMHVGRFFFTATLLGSGRVLVAGGVCDNQGCVGSQTSSAELFNPATGTFARTGRMSIERSSHTATLLTDGTVLVAGGSSPAGVTATAELYHPLIGTFARTGNMRKRRELHTATKLSNGEILVTGGTDGSITLSSAELFVPTSGSFMSAANMKNVRQEHAAALLEDGRVLITGGINTNNGALTSLATAELFH